MQFRLFSYHVAINWRWLLITLAAFSILIKLSYWQWQRAEDKTLQLHELAVQQQKAPLTGVTLAQLTADSADGMLFKDQAKWLAPYIWLLDNQIVEGRVGYDVVIPVQFSETTTAALLNLGWVAAPADRRNLPTIDLPSVIVIDGLVRTRLGGLLLGQNFERTDYPMRMQKVDLSALQAQVPVALYPAVIYQQHASSFLPHYQPVVLSPEKHQGYAVQWFGLACAVLAVAGAASLQRRKHNE